MKELKFTDFSDNYKVISEIESLEERNEFGCILNFCPMNSLDCIGNLF